jgi:hypothetical protein
MATIDDLRLAGLERELLADPGSSPFVIDEKAARWIELRHYRGGRDATYVAVMRRSPQFVVPSSPVVATIGYARFVEGTTIIYDATDESLQGKARPFVCDLTHTPIRFYALLPVQIEEIVVLQKGMGDAAQIHVAFLDARGEPLEAALPFELQMCDSRGISFQSEYCATDRQGRFSRSLQRSFPPATVRVRSLLTGRDASLSL